jgi:hypothetical protein
MFDRLPHLIVPVLIEFMLGIQVIAIARSRWQFVTRFTCFERQY